MIKNTGREWINAHRKEMDALSSIIVIVVLFTSLILATVFLRAPKIEIARCSPTARIVERRQAASANGWFVLEVAHLSSNGGVRWYKVQHFQDLESAIAVCNTANKPAVFIE